MNSNIKSSVYAQKVELLLRLIPIVMDEGVFAIHGGTAINLFLKDLPRYSVDIDLTYIPLADRETSLDDINKHLQSISDKAKKAFKGMHIVPNFNTCKLLCEYRGKQVKIEVNQTKRGIVGGEVLTVSCHAVKICYFSCTFTGIRVTLRKFYHINPIKHEKNFTPFSDADGRNHELGAVIE